MASLSADASAQGAARTHGPTGRKYNVHVYAEK